MLDLARTRATRTPPRRYVTRAHRMLGLPVPAIVDTNPAIAAQGGYEYTARVDPARRRARPDARAGRRRRPPRCSTRRRGARRAGSCSAPCSRRSSASAERSAYIEATRAEPAELHQEAQGAVDVVDAMPVSAVEPVPPPRPAAGSAQLATGGSADRGRNAAADRTTAPGGGSGSATTPTAKTTKKTIRRPPNRPPGRPPTKLDQGAGEVTPKVTPEPKKPCDVYNSPRGCT